MLKVFYLMICCTILQQSLTAQIAYPKDVQHQIDEGKRLYRSEMASWNGTDIFFAKRTDSLKIGGYFSYEDQHTEKCVFYTAGDDPRIFATITFDTTLTTDNATFTENIRNLTDYEHQLYTIREAAKKLMRTDSIFKFYQRTDMNLIPIINGKERKVYILTGPKDNGVVIFGNDYLIRFDKHNKPIETKALHQHVTFHHYKDKDKEGKPATFARHNHLEGEGRFFTATDICTLMLYGKYTQWETYTIVDPKYISMWNCKNNLPVIMTREAVQRIVDDKDAKKE